MKKIVLTLFIFYISLFTLSAQSWLWARQGRNHTWQNDGHGITMDNLHNAYLTGTYNSDTIVFNSDTLFGMWGKNQQYLPYLIKYNETGNVLWAKSAQSSIAGRGYSSAVTCDKQNNVYITGYFWDTLYFQSFSLENAYNNHNYDVFLVKYDSNGNVLWAKQSKDNGIPVATNYGESLITDKYGDIYVTGQFDYNIYFDSDTLKTIASQTNVFLVKYSPSGNVLWAKQSVDNKSGSSSVPGFNCITIDKSGYVYVAGYFIDTVYFGNQRLVSPDEDAFVVKYDSNGNVIWASQSHIVSSKSTASAYGICIDNKGNTYIDGQFYDTVNFGATTLIGPHNQQGDLFWAKLDKNGNFLWAKQIYELDSLTWLTFSIQTDASGNLYIPIARDAIGYPKAKIVIDSDTLQLNKGITPWAFIKMDSSGTVLNGYIFESGDGGGQAIAVDSSGCYVYLGSSADSSVIFGPDTIGPYEYKHSSQPNWPYIARWSYGECTTGINTIKSPALTVNLYPNPNCGNFNLIVSHAELVSAPQTNIEICNILGAEIYSTSFAIDNSPFTINLSSQPAGLYLYRITDQQSNLLASGKFIIQ